MNKHFDFKMTRPISHVQIWAPSLVVWLQSFHNKMSIILKNNLNYFLLFNKKNRYLCLHVHWGQNHFFTNISCNGGVKHPICQPLTDWSQVNIVTTPIAYPHNIQRSFVGTITKDGSIQPSTLRKWHGAQ